MKTLTRTLLALLSALLFVPGYAAANDQFHALSNLTATELTPLDDDRLAAVEGGLNLGNINLGNIIIVTPDVNVNVGLNLANIIQLNICVFCRDVFQGNGLDSVQGIDL